MAVPSKIQGQPLRSVPGVLKYPEAKNLDIFQLISSNTKELYVKIIASAANSESFSGRMGSDTFSLQPTAMDLC